MNTATPTRRLAGKLAGSLSAGLIVCAAATLSVLGSAAPADAATGANNRGVSQLTLTPTAPAVDFSTPGTKGTLSWSIGDGTPPGAWTLDTGDSEKQVTTLPHGLTFQNDPCAGENYPQIFDTSTCTLSADGRTLTQIWTWNGPHSTWLWDFMTSSSSYPVVSTGPVSGSVTATYTPPSGLVSASTSSSSWSVPTPTATGVSGPDGSGRYTLNGTGEAGDTIRVTDATGTEIGSTVVTPDGNWSVKLPQTADFSFTITQYKVGIGSDPIQYTAAPVPAVSPIIGFGALGLLVVGGGAAIAIGRQRRRPARA